jgi:hypothetical protein
MKHKTRGRADLVALAGLFVAIISAIAAIIVVPKFRRFIGIEPQTPEPTPTPWSVSSLSGVRIVSQEEQAEMIKAAERDATESRKAAAKDVQLRIAEIEKAVERSSRLRNWESIKKVRSGELTSFSLYLYPDDWSPPIDFPPRTLLQG